MKVELIERDFDASFVEPQLGGLAEIDIGLPPARTIDPGAEAQDNRAVAQRIHEDERCWLGMYALILGDLQ